MKGSKGKDQKVKISVLLTTFSQSKDCTLLPRRPEPNPMELH